MAAALEELLGAEVVDGSGKKVAVKSLAGDGKIIGIYFSAHWCPPCRGFTPDLAEFYKNKALHGDKFEVVFVSSDRDDASWKEYFGEMPWLALPFSDRPQKEKLAQKYGVQGIPTLVIVDGNSGELITKDGRGCVNNRPDAFPWK